MEGWCSVEKACAMAALILRTRPAISVEIGVFGGRSLVAQALACRHVGGLVWGVDPWKADAALCGVAERENIEWWSKIDYETIYRGCISAVLAQGLTQACNILRTTSDRAVLLFDDKSIDIVHIDGNHSEGASTLDVSMWLPKLKQGGHIWFDDTDWSSTKKAQNMLSEACDQLGNVGTCALYQKRGKL
jgi:predicted O-methyltransferase YrrM